MEVFIIILLGIIAGETTYLTIRETRRIRVNGRKKQQPIFVDTSVLIDGRIVAIAQSGFITDTLQIPRSVIRELQYLADNADGEKRARARHGLDVVAELQALPSVTTEIYQDDVRVDEGVDERLLTLARQNNGVVCTIDFNLNKVAQVERIPVLNVNDLAMSLRMSHLPGERIQLALTSKGNDSHQAVGHLADGTMVVVEQAKAKIGSVVEVEVIRSLQTSAGKMMFARLTEAAPSAAAQAPRKATTKQKVVAKTRGTKAKPAEPVTAAPVATPTVTASVPEKKAKAPQARRTRPQGKKKSQDGESRLIELVNKQD